MLVPEKFNSEEYELISFIELMYIKEWDIQTLKHWIEETDYRVFKIDGINCLVVNVETEKYIENEQNR